jgi:signal transduction histidine kinase
MAMVSVRTIGFVKEACAQAGIDYRALVADVPGIDAVSRGRIEWDTAVEVFERVQQALGGPAALEQQAMRANDVSSATVQPLRLVVGGLADARLIYRAVGTWFGPRLTPFMRSTYTDLNDGRCRMELEIPPEQRACEPFFRYLLGSIRSAPRLLGQPDAIVEAEISPRHAVYLITPPAGHGLFTRLARGLRTVSSQRRALAELANQQSELRKNYEALVASRNDFERVLASVPQGVIVLRDGTITYVNPAAAATLGFADTLPLRGRRLVELAPPESAGPLADWLSGAAGPASTLELGMVTPDQRPVSIELARPQRVVFGGERSILLMARDVTATRQLESQLRQAQKMEVVGRLAGGVAHDFNNVLSVILSYSEMLIEEPPPPEQMRSDLDEIRKAGLRAAALTRQLLAFSRQQVLTPRVLLVSEMVRESERMLGRLLGADITLSVDNDPALWKVKVDPGQLDQVIMNLAVNARDAMPGGGRLTIETRNVVLGEEYAAAHMGASPGEHVMIAVGDTGTGMDEATRAKIFEPFFTTKAKGKGTGLGLATVHGIVQQSGGSISVDSQLGVGTTFRVYLPRAAGAAEEAAAAPVAPLSLRGHETILLAEDDEQVRQVARGILERSGYRVLESKNPGEALQVAARHTGSIQLLLTDVVMPQMNGRQLAERLAPLRPDMKVLYMSGYTEDVFRRGILEPGIALVEKPLTPELLARRVREILDEAPSVTREQTAG